MRRRPPIFQTSRRTLPPSTAFPGHPAFPKLKLGPALAQPSMLNGVAMSAMRVAFSYYNSNATEAQSTNGIRGDYKQPISRAADFTPSSRRAQSSDVVSQPALNRRARPAASGGMFIAVSTCDGFSFPLAHAEPVETAKPSRSITTTQRRRQSGCSGMMTDDVFQSRLASAPSTLAPGSAEQSSFSKSSRHAARLLVVDIAASRSSSAATIARIPATFSVPARRAFSCGPPRSKGEKSRGHFKNPTPCGPPNLCAQPLTKSQTPSPQEGSFPIH